MPRANATTDHQQIRRWVEARNGHPAVVRSSEGRGSGNSGADEDDVLEGDEDFEDDDDDEGRH